MQTVIVPMESLAQIIQLQLEQGGRSSLTVTGNSMRPMLTSHRDTVTLIPPDDPKTGDIILYRRSGGEYVLHRIIDRTPDGYICCGDNQAVHEPVAPEQLIAKVDSFVKNGRECSVDAPLYQFYTTVWMRLFTLRRLYFAVRRRLGRVYRKLFRRK